MNLIVLVVYAIANLAMNFERGFSGEENDEIRDVSNSVHSNGSCYLQNSDYHEMLGELKSQVRKGYGLKKWRRIKRDCSKVGESSVNTVKMITEELPNLSLKPSKRAQVYAEKDQKSEGSLSSRTPVIGNLGISPLSGDHSLENSEDGSSKSSTAASVPLAIYDNILSGKKLAQKGKIKKTRGERIKPEKEDSDLSSFNHVLMEGPYVRINGIGSERLVHYGGENGDKVRENGGYEEISTQDVIPDLSPEIEKEKIDDHGSSLDQDPLVESIYGLQTAQEALEKEVLKLKEIGKDISVDDSDSNTQPEITENSEQFPSDDKQNFSWAVHPKMLEIAKRDAEREIEDLFKQRIEAEVEYLTISRTVQKMKVPSMDRITCLDDKAKMLKKKAEKLENRCEEIASSDEALKLQNKVCKYTLYFLVQLLLLLVILGAFEFQISPNYVELVPT